MVTVSEHLDEKEIRFEEPAEQFYAVCVEVALMLGWGVSNLHSGGFSIHARQEDEQPSLFVHLSGQSLRLVSNDPDEGGAMADKYLSATWNARYYFTHEELQQKYTMLAAQFVPQPDTITAAEPPVSAPTRSIGSIKDYPVTALLVLANLIVFFTMVALGMDVLEPDSRMMIQWGANYGADTLAGDWWRLLSSCFLHFGILHLLMNMYALMYIGFLLEPYLGKLRFFTAYMLTGLVASMVSVWWHPHAVAAGASGAVFGMYGVLLAMLTTNFIERKVRRPLLFSIAFYVLYNLSYGLKEGIDNAAHTGGLLSGMLMGYVFIISLKKPLNQTLKYVTTLLLAAVTISLTAATYKSMPNTMAIYHKEMKRFSDNERRAYTVYELPGNAATGEKLRILNDSGLVIWKENLQITRRLEALDLPAPIRERNQVIQQYANLRIQSVELMKKAVSGHTNQYDARIAELHSEMEDILYGINSK